MKKSFTLKAFAFGAAAAVALSASATPNDFLKVNLEKTNQLRTASVTEAPAAREISKIDHITTANKDLQKAPVQKAAPSYGNWADKGTCEYTFTQLWSAERKATYNYQRRDDSANPGDFQIKIADFGKGILSTNGVELILSIQKIMTDNGEMMAVYAPENGVNLNFQIGDGEGGSYACYYFDHYNWAKKMQQYKPDKYTDETVASWKDISDFDEVQGLITILPAYVPEMNAETAGMAIPWYITNTAGTEIVGYKFETLRLSGDEYVDPTINLDYTLGYFSHEKNATTGSFNLKYNIHDNNEAWFKIVTGKKSGTTLNNEMQSLMQAAYEGTTSDDIIKVTASTGEVSIPVKTYRKGQYTLLGCARYPGQEDGYFSTISNNTLRLVQDDLDFYAAGTAEYSDAMLYDGLMIFSDVETWEDLQGMFQDELGIELPDQYTVTVPMQESSTTPGEFRLVRPYGEFYQNYLSSLLDYDSASDYLVFNISDKNKSYIKPSASGIYFEASNNKTLMITYGSTNKMNGGWAASADAWGTCANGVLSFPEISVPEGAESVDQIFTALSHSQAEFNTTTGAITYANWAAPIWNPELCKIEGAALAGIENVAADAEFDVNAPVEYFNLQGIRVATPEAGQILIKRQGSKASKVVIR